MRSDGGRNNERDTGLALTRRALARQSQHIARCTLGQSGYHQALQDALLPFFDFCSETIWIWLQR